MGRNSRLKAERRELRQRGVHIPVEKRSVDEMLICPLCNAYSYPGKIANPKNEEERKALICKSCGENVVPYLDAVKEYQKVQAEREKVLKEIKAEPTNSEAVERIEAAEEIFGKSLAVPALSVPTVEVPELEM